MQIAVFQFQSPEERQFNDIRTIEIDGEVWFVASDVARILGYKRPSEAVRQHCKVKGTVKYRIPTDGGNQEVLLVNESNVYRLIISSKLSSAEVFEAWLFEEVVPQIRKRGYYGNINRSKMPNFIERYKANYHKLPNDHFSVISEMYTRLYMTLEKAGYSIPDEGASGQHMMPDISVGKGFASFLKANASPYWGRHKTYTHSFPDGREVEANMYHIDALPMFIRYVNEVWIPKNAVNYFKSRDPLALDYLPKLLKAG
jgi:prophage antirepressor-like protein